MEKRERKNIRNNDRIRCDTLERRFTLYISNELGREQVSMTTYDNGYKECNDDAPTFDTLSISSIDIYLSSALGGNSSRKWLSHSVVRVHSILVT